MKKFIDLTPEESKGLYEPLYENAVKLKEDSYLLATENKSFSTATSLLILSSEELIKAILVLLHSEGYNVYKNKEAKEFFKDHKIRHQICQLIESGYGLLEAREKWNESKRSFKSNRTVLGSILEGAYLGYQAHKPLSKSIKRVEKLQEFNDLKNKGLYVDFRDVLVVPSVSVDEREYNLVRPITERLFKFYEKIEMLFHQSEKNQMSTTESEKFKDDLTLLIDRALKDFSFKDLKNLK